MTEETKINSSDISNVLTAIFNSVEEENKASFELVASIPGVQRSLECVRKGDYRGFYFALMYPISKMVNGLLAKELPNSPDAQFLLNNSRFIENHFKRLIEKLEGSACCADKTRTIMKELLRFLTNGKEITFDYTQEYTYHLPVLLFNTHDEIVVFFKALRHLHFGYPDQYIETLAKIYKRFEELRATTLLNNL
jgi:hypothetical protein